MSSSHSTTTPPLLSNPPPRPGRIIFLNGSSSSGKTTLARALQLSLPTPFLILSSDIFVDSGICLPPQRITSNPIILQLPIAPPNSTLSAHLSPSTSPSPFNWTTNMRPKFFSGFHGTIAAMARAGNDLIVDHVVEYAEWWTELDVLLRGLDVWVVGVRCAVEEVERREQGRKDRFAGEGRAHLEINRVHDLVVAGGRGGYDFEIDMTEGLVGRKGEEEGGVKALIEAWGKRRVVDEERGIGGGIG